MTTKYTCIESEDNPQGGYTYFSCCDLFYYAEINTLEEAQAELEGQVLSLQEDGLYRDLTKITPTRYTADHYGDDAYGNPVWTTSYFDIVVEEIEEEEDMWANLANLAD